jgi:hypothetical protein
LGIEVILKIFLPTGANIKQSVNVPTIYLLKRKIKSPSHRLEQVRKYRTID